MSDVTPVGRAEEKRLLAAWFATTTFDEVPDGNPPALANEEDDED